MPIWKNELYHSQVLKELVNAALLDELPYGTDIAIKPIILDEPVIDDLHSLPSVHTQPYRHKRLNSLAFSQDLYIPTH